MAPSHPDRPDPSDWPTRVGAAHDRLTQRGHVDPVVAVATPAGRVVAGAVTARFEIGSVTKLFTALLLARMAELALVDPSVPVGDLLPVGTPLGAGVPDITLESLACHRSGLPRLPPGLWLSGMRRGGRADPYAEFDEERLLRALAETRVRGTPGEAPIAYSNFGAGLLGHLLGRVAGTGYAAALTEHVLQPLGIAATTDLTDDDLRPGRSGRRVVGPWHLAELAGAGGLRAPAADLLTFLEAVRDETGPLARATADTLRPRGSRGPMQVGLGWFMLGGGDLLTHDGGTGGARSEVRLERHSGICVVVLGDARRGTAKVAGSLLDPLPGAAPEGARRAPS